MMKKSVIMGIIIIMLILTFSIDIRGKYYFKSDRENTKGFWIESDKLMAQDGITGDQFGTSVFINENDVFIGAPGDDVNGQWSGSVYLFSSLYQGMGQKQKVVPTDSHPFHYFGTSICVYEDIALIGASGDNENGKWSGAAYLYERTNDNWKLKTKLTPHDGEAFDNFGFSVALSNQVAIVGAPGEDTNGEWAGAVYLYEKTQDDWIQTMKIIPRDGRPGDGFGTALSLENNRFVVGAPSDNNNDQPGSIYVFAKFLSPLLSDQNQWRQKAKISSPSNDIDDHFGKTLDLMKNRIAVGAPLDNENGDRSGAVYIFDWINDKWTLSDKLLVENGSSISYFGKSLSLYEDSVLIGSDNKYQFSSQAVYLFQKNLSDWVQKTFFIQNSTEYNNEFGFSCSMIQNLVCIGSPSDREKGNNSGAVFVYRYSYDTSSPSVTIVHPTEALYFKGEDVFPTDNTVVIGRLVIRTKASDDLSGVRNQSIFIDENMIYQTNSSEVSIIWDVPSFGKYTLRIQVFDQSGNCLIKEKEIWKFF